MKDLPGIVGILVILIEIYRLLRGEIFLAIPLRQGCTGKVDQAYPSEQEPVLTNYAALANKHLR
jgi:hypothetical protein